MTRMMIALPMIAPKIHRISKMTMTKRPMIRKMKNPQTAKFSKPRLIQ